MTVLPRILALPKRARNRLPKWLQECSNPRWDYYVAMHVATPDWANRKAIALIYRQAKAFGREVDHIIPLRHPHVCGLHVEDNLRIATTRENSNKSNNHWPDMFNEQQDWVGSYEPQQLSLWRL